VRLPDFIRTATFGWTTGAFSLCIFLFSAFVYWQTAAYVTDRIDVAIADEARIIAKDAPERRLDAIDDRLRQDPRRIKLAGLFDADGRRIVGNLESLPPSLDPAGHVRSVMVVRIDRLGREQQTARAVARHLPNGEVLVIGRNIDELEGIAKIVGRSLLLGLPLALCFSVAIGMLLSARAQKRINALNQLIQQIVAGGLRQRLPTDDLDHPFDKLVAFANGMLDEIEALIHEIAAVGDEIAHDLRTPLTRVRISLERGRANAKTLEELRAVTDRAINGLDQSLAIVTALLRIAEIEHSHRLVGFGEVALEHLVREVGDLYEPIAEDKLVALTVKAAEQSTVCGDRDLLLEAIANLVDNAMKFTPEGGRVHLELVHGRDENVVVRISDTGPGIRESEMQAVTRRFYRSDKSRHTHGLGLGLSLVAAIVKLHGFRFTISSGPGCIVEIACPRMRG
jgi:signal transduction histidine kinase